MDWKPKILVLGPGGFKGFVYLGGILRLRECGFLEEITHYVGVSVGSMICALLIGGISIEKIIVEGFGIDLISSFVDDDVKLGDIVDRLGLIRHEIIREKLGKIFIEKFHTIPTLDEFFRLTGKKLTVVTSNVSRREVQYINYENSPHLSVVDAVLMSSNIPIIFPYFEMNGDFFVDGAVGNPFPIDYVDDKKTPIMGLIVKSTFDEKIDIKKISGVVQYLFRSFNFPIEELEKTKLKGMGDNCHVFIVRIGSIDTLGLTTNQQKKMLMVVEGYCQTNTLIERMFHPISPSRSIEDLKKVFSP